MASCVDVAICRGLPVTALPHSQTPPQCLGLMGRGALRTRLGDGLAVEGSGKPKKNLPMAGEVGMEVLWQLLRSSRLEDLAETTKSAEISSRQARAEKGKRAGGLAETVLIGTDR